MIACWWRRRRCMHGQPMWPVNPDGISYVKTLAIVDSGRKLYECKEDLGGCGKRWVW